MEKPNKLTTKKLIVIIIALFLVCACGLGLLLFLRNNIKEVASTEDYGYVNPDETKAEADAGFTIDGVLDEQQYKNNNWLYLHNKEGGVGVEVAMTSYYGDKGMYFVYDVTEQTPIYVNTDRASYLNSCIEMYLAPSTVTATNQNSLFEIDLLPTGDMTFKKSNGKGGYVNVATTDDMMAVLGATTKGGSVNTEECYGYCLELFIPWEYMDKFDLNSDAMKGSFVYVDPAHITSFNFEGTDTSVDRYWYYFAQQHGAGFSDVYQYFRFDEDGVQGTVPVELQAGEHYTIEGAEAVIPGMKTNVTITPEAGYTISSILINGEEYIKKANFNEDGSITINERGVKGGVKISATAVPVTDGNKTLSGTVVANKLGGGSLKDVSASYNGPTGEKPLELDSNGKFTLTDLKQGYYTITIEKEGYEKLVRGIYLNRDMEVELSLEYQTFAVTKGACWILDDQNEGILHKFGGSGNLLSNDKYNKFTVEANFKFDAELAKAAKTDAYTQQRQGFRFAFSNEKTWHIDLLQQDGKYIVQYAKHSGANSVFGWREIHTMTEAEVAKFTSEDGIKLSVQRDGKYANVYLDGKLIAVEVLDDEYAKATAQIGFESWVANREIMEVPYKITTTTSVNLKSTLFKTAKGWDVSGQYNGLITMPEGGRGNLQFVNKYANMDLTIRVKDDRTTKEYNDKGEEVFPRTDILFVFDNGAHVSFGITSDENGARIQSLNNAANTVDGKPTQYIYKRWTEWGALTEEEFEQFKKDGVDFRIVRYGTEVTLYIGDRMVAVADLTNNNSGVTADMKATVTIRHYDDAGVKVEMPFELTDKFDLVKITTVAGQNGSVATEKQQYFVGDTVKLLSGKDDYYCTWMKVDGKDVTINWDGTYSFTATKKEYTVTGDLGKKIFAESKEWNLLKQNEGKLIIPNSDGDSDWVKTVANTYGDVDLTFTLIDQKSEDKNFRTAVRLYFTNGETVTFTVTNDTKDGSYILQNMNGTILSWKSTGYTLNAEQTAKITSSEGLEMHIVRIGSGVDIYFGDEHAYGFDLSTNMDGEDSDVEDVTAQIGVRQYGNTSVDAEIGFEFTEAEEPVKITIEDSENGTAVTKQMHYFAGQTVIVSGKGDAGYYCLGMEVDGEEVTLNWDGTYSFEAKKDGHTLKGSFSEQIFKDNSAWDLVEQNKNYKEEDGVITADGVIALPNGGNGGWLEFYDKYTDMDLTLKVRDHQESDDQGSKWPRTDVLFLFDVDGDGKYDGEKDVNVSFGVTTNANSAWIQSLNNGANANNPNRIYDIFTAHGDLTAEEYQQFKEDGVEFRIVRKGTDIHLYIGDRKVNVRDIADFHQNDGLEGATGVTADTPATVYIRHYDDAGVENLEFEYSVTEVMPENAIINIADGIEKGTITTQLDSNKYFVGDRVALITTGESGYYYDSLKVNDKAVNVDENTLLPTFTAKAENEVTGSFAPEVFTNIREWNANHQNVGILAAVKSDGDTNWIDTKDSAYRGIALTVQDKNSSAKNFGVALHLAFENGESFRFRLHNTDSDGKYRIQTMNGDTLFANWNSPYTLSDDETAKITGEDGIEFRVTIVGDEVFVYLAGKDTPACSFDLSKNGSGEDSGVGNCAAKVSIRFYGNIGYNTLIPYELEEAKAANLTITNEPSDCGTVEVLNAKNYVNGTITLKPVGAEGYGCFKLVVNGEEVKLDDYGTYTFIAAEENTVVATFKRKVILNINVPTGAENGTITAKKDYFIGDTVELVVAPAAGYNCKDFVVKQGEDAVLTEKVIFAEGTYSFTAEKDSYTIEGNFVEKIFSDGDAQWDITTQYEGVVSIPNTTGQTRWLYTDADAYRDIAVTVRDHNTKANSFKTELTFTFTNGANYKVRLDNEDKNIGYRVQNLKGSINNNWGTVYQLSDSEIAKLQGEGGIEFRVAFVGTTAKIYLDGVEVHSLDASGKITTETAKIQIRMYGNTGVKDIEIPFALGGEPKTVTVDIAETTNGTITSDKTSYIVGEKVVLTVAGDNCDDTDYENDYYYNSLNVNGEEVTVELDGTYTFTATETNTVTGSFAKTIFKTNQLKSWHIMNQHKGIIVQRDDFGTGNAAGMDFVGNHVNSDVSITVKANDDDFNADGTLKDNGSLGHKSGDRTAISYWTKNANVGFGILLQTDGTYHVAHSGSYNKWGSFYALSEDETKMITEGDGIELRVIRNGKNAYIYLDGKHISTYVLPYGETETTTVFIRRWDDGGVLAPIPYTFSKQLQAVTVNVAETTNGTVTTDKTSYVVGEKVVLTVAGASGYYYNSLKVDGKEVIADWDGTYTFTATKTNHTIEASFAPALIKSTVTGWDLINQNVGIVRATYQNGNGNTNWLDFADKYTNIDVTMMAREYPDTVKPKLTRTALRFTFDNKKVITFSVAKNTAGSGYKYSIQALSGDNIVKSNYDFYIMNQDEIDAFNSEEGIEFRVIRTGTTVDVYLGGNLVVNDFDLTQGGTTGVTADMKMAVTIRRFDDPLVTELPLVVKSTVSETQTASTFGARVVALLSDITSIFKED